MGDESTLFQSEILQAILGGIGEGFILTDTEETVLYMNPAAERMLACEKKMWANKKFLEVCPLVNVNTGKAYPSPLKKAFTEWRSVGLAQNTGLLREQKKIFLSATCSPIKSPENSAQLWGGTVILRDVSRMRELELRVASDQHYMRAVFSAAMVGLCILNEAGEIIDINRSGLDIMETTSDECLDLQFGDAFHCENSLERGCGHGEGCRHCPIRRNIEAAILDDSFSSEFTVMMHSVRRKQVIWLKICVSQAQGPEGKQIIVALVDETARKDYERQLENARIASEEANRSKLQFLSNMSHEIRTPINGLIGMMKLAEKEPMTEKQQICLQNAEQCADDLLRLINDILDFSKLDSGRMVLEHIDFDLHKNIMWLIGTYQQLAECKGLTMVTPDVRELPRFINGDPLRLRQIFHNLLSNAVKFTEKGKITMTASVGVQQGMERLEFCIRDTGIGMTEKEMEKLFRAFSQVDSSTTRRFGGSGLGLMIVRKLLDNMGGTIHVESEPGKGTAFYFWIPLIRAEGAEAEVREQRVILKPKDVLTPPVLHEDNDDLEELMQYCLQKLEDSDLGKAPKSEE